MSSRSDDSQQEEDLSVQKNILRNSPDIVLPIFIMVSRSDDSQQEEDLSIQKNILRNSPDIVLPIFVEFIEKKIMVSKYMEEIEVQNSQQGIDFKKLNQDFEVINKIRSSQKRKSFQKSDVIYLIHINDGNLVKNSFYELFDSQDYITSIKNNSRLKDSQTVYLENLPLVWMQELEKDKPLQFKNLSTNENAKKLNLNQDKMKNIDSEKKKNRSKKNRNQIEEQSTPKKQKVEKLPESSFVSTFNQEGQFESDDVQEKIQSFHQITTYFQIDSEQVNDIFK